MKKVITLSITSIFCIVFAANAQINKGSIMLGGVFSGSFNNLKDPDTIALKTNTITIQPSIGLAIDTNTILGVALYYGNKTDKYFTINEKTKNFGAGIFFRKYKQLGKNFYLFGEGDLLYSHSSYDYSSINPNGSEYDSKGNAIQFYITPGIAYSLTRSLQLEAGLQNIIAVFYSTTNEKALTPGNQDYKTSGAGFSSSLNPVQLSGIFVGVRFLFNK